MTFFILDNHFNNKCPPKENKRIGLDYLMASKNNVERLLIVETQLVSDITI